MTDKKKFTVAIASGKGGTGKTFLATHLAAWLSRDNDVVLADLDVEEPNAGLFFDFHDNETVDQNRMFPAWDESRCTFCGTCTGVCNFHAIIQLGRHIATFSQLCHSCYACSELCPENALPMVPMKTGATTISESGKLHFIESRLDVGQEQAVPLIHATQLLADHRFRGIPCRIFDCPPGTSCPVVAAVNQADYVILVTEPTPFGFNDLQLAVRLMRQLEKPFGVVINRYGTGNSDIETYCSREEIDILARIHFDRRIAEQYSEGRLSFEQSETLDQALFDIVSNITQLQDKCMRS